MLYEKLKQYGSSHYYPFHMPGHKRNRQLIEMGDPYSIDITEIDGFDDLHHADGILKDAMDRAARIYGSEDTFFLVNGSTVGLLAAISACARHGDKIAVARNCHKSVYHSIFINELNPVYIYPQYHEKLGISEEISPKDVDKLLAEHRDVKLVAITSPTYEGVVSDIREIARVSHSYGVPLLVDEAHGAHFGFHPAFPQSSVAQGADLVVQSVHKTLPSFTQTALLHRNHALVSRQQVKKYLDIYETSSPSYVLMAGIDRCMGLLESRSPELFSQYAKNLEWFYEQAGQLKALQFLKQQTSSILDLSKIVILVKNTTMTGRKLYDILLQEFHLQMEMCEADYVIAMTSLADTREGLGRLANAVKEIDKRIGWEKKQEGKEGASRSGLPGKMPSKKGAAPVLPVAKVSLTPYEAEKREGYFCPLEKSQGKISKEYAYLYPPGVPILAPGEEISHEVVELLHDYKENGLPIRGLQDKKILQIEVVQ